MEIISYIKIPNIKLPDDFEQEPEKYFIHIDDKERIINIINQFDQDYLEGALIMKYKNSQILCFELWDYVGDLWAYLLNAVEEFLMNRKGECYLPDQPIKIEILENRYDSIKFIVGEGKYGCTIIPKLIFLQTIINEAEHFFMRFNEYFMSHQYNFHVNQLVKLRATLVSDF
ncbi:hypothetical protein J2Z69_000996 [Paenibacillus shirakamiensis]|uniref:Uncharacterized protein n=1 Tax=Paenibacillus shirakamiensis TaxID=1265935 RepID=A0ABS4JE24_9BACL|nr:hypothetical protein [Paenibacillus shirakamiensis]MBP1999977.1 hypothetical protein [Paenibacillus shirakamiensis]